MFTIRFDMRAPNWAGSAADLYAAAIDMCAWAETRGAVLAVLSEHHGTDDGHLPAPLMLASAIAARTRSLAILLAAVSLPLWDPVRLAEEMSVLDLISRGRVSYAFGVGHRSSEYEQFGIDMATRGRVADEILAVLGPLVRGESVEYRGRTIRVTPPCGSPTGPMVLIAGGSKAAARRAGAFGLGFISQTDSPGLKGFYEEQCRAHGHEPGIIQFPVRGAPTAVSLPTMLMRRGMRWGRTCCTTRSWQRRTGRTTIRWPASRGPTAWPRFAPRTARTAFSHPTRRPSMCAAGASFRCTRCVVACHPMWRGHTSNVPLPRPPGPAIKEGAYACCRVVDRGSRGGRDRCH